VALRKGKKRRTPKTVKGALKKTKAKTVIAEAIDISPEIEPLWRDPLIKIDDNKTVTIDEIVYATRVAHGIPTFAARFLGMSRSKYAHIVKHNRRVAQVAKNEKESIIDLAEGRLYEALAEGYSWAIKYVLDTQGKERGWTTEINKETHEGEILKSIENMTVMDKEELQAYDEEQEGHDYDKRSKYQLLGTTD